ncbi:hypothetical protein B0H17DRAFT_1207246 [Mycena rosella]|uniref:Uncharacterized protein n=1 Tax=Mycena rosella TaxID=1033263 RepID=A0AAD7D4Q9_MYCRO|nr:hypothetical protein B0H17DRAFT_1207246 [Mycena rosella]
MPIAKLPADVLIHCFHFCCGSFTEDASMFYASMLGIHHVCQDWQDISGADAFGWSHLYIDSDGDLSDVRGYVTLAGDCDLRVHVELRRPSDTIYDTEIDISEDLAAFLSSLASMMEMLARARMSKKVSFASSTAGSGY